MADVKINVSVVSGAAVAAVDSLKNRTKDADKAFKGLNLNIKNTTSAFKVFAGNLAAIGVSKLVRGMFDLAKSSIEVGGRLETVTTQLEVLTGSAAVAAQTVKDLQEFSAQTPFQFEDLAKATQRLISFGFSVEEAKANLIDLGDVSAASGTDIGELSLIFGQVAAAGKLTGERLLQLQERAIPIGPAIAKTMGISEKAVRDAVTAGKVDFKTFEAAFKSLNDTGSFAFEGMIKRSQTLEGRISTLKDNFTLLQASLSGQLAPILKTVVSSLTSLIQTIQTSGGFESFIQDLASRIPQAIQFFAGSLQFLNNAFQSVRIVINVVRAAFNAFAAGAIDIVVAMNNAEIAVKKFLGIDVSGIQEQNKFLTQLKDTFIEVGEESLAANIEIEKSQASVNAAIQQGADFVVAQYLKEVEAVNQVGEAAGASAQKVIAAEQAKLNFLQLLAEDQKTKEQERIAEDLIQKQALEDQNLQFLVDNLGAQETVRLQAQATQLVNEGKQAEALKVIADARVKAQDAADKEIIQNRKSTLSTIAGLQSSSNKTLAAIGKAAAITQIAIETPVAVSRALSAFPPPFNFAAAGLVAAAMAAQAAKIAGVQFESGGIVGGNSFTGDKVQARVNSGEMILNRQQQMELFKVANGAGGMGGQIIQSNITVELDGDVVARSVSRRVADGLELGKVV